MDHEKHRLASVVDAAGIELLPRTHYEDSIHAKTQMNQPLHRNGPPPPPHDNALPENIKARRKKHTRYAYADSPSQILIRNLYKKFYGDSTSQTLPLSHHHHPQHHAQPDTPPCHDQQQHDDGEPPGQKQTLLGLGAAKASTRPIKTRDVGVQTDFKKHRDRTSSYPLQTPQPNLCHIDPSTEAKYAKLRQLQDVYCPEMRSAGIRNYMNTRTFNTKEASEVGAQTISCYICSAHYKDGQKIGVLDCGHDYHAHCIQESLLNKNACPVCSVPSTCCYAGLGTANASTRPIPIETREVGVQTKFKKHRDRSCSYPRLTPHPNLWHTDLSTEAKYAKLRHLEDVYYPEMRRVGIRNHMNMRTFNTKEASEVGAETNSCYICWNYYDDGEKIGVLDCGHDYHAECIQESLFYLNACPVCGARGYDRRVLLSTRSVLDEIMALKYSLGLRTMLVPSRYL